MILVSRSKTRLKISHILLKLILGMMVVVVWLDKKMNFVAPTAIGIAVTGMALGTCATALVVYHEFARVEPMVTVRPCLNRMNVELSGVSATPVKTTYIKHEGVECLEKNHFQIMRKAHLRVLPGHRIFPGKSASIEPALVIFVPDSIDSSEDVNYENFVDACVKCQTATHVKYKNFFGFEREKRLRWV
jgi:hypothetical protein